MKTAAEFIKEISASEDLQRELTSIGKGQYAEIGTFLKKHDCGASAEEFVDYVKSVLEGEISDDEASIAAGGKLGKKDVVLFPEDLPPLPPEVLAELEIFKWF